MFKKFAVQPTALRRFDYFRYVMEKLAFDQGRVLLCYPKAWPRAVLDSLECGDIERTRFVELLHKYKEDRMVSSGLPYDGALGWLANVLQLDGSVYDKLIVDENASWPSSATDVAQISAVDEEFFRCPREIRCLNTAQNLAQAAKVLLHKATRVALVDPYFKAEQRNRISVLTALVDLALDGGRTVEFFIFTNADYLPKDRGATARKAFDGGVRRCLPKGLGVTFYFIDRGASRQSFHARYLLTDKGGLRYDRGFEAPIEPEVVDISIIDGALNRELCGLYLEDGHDLQVVETFAWRY